MRVQADRAKKAAEAERADAADRAAELSGQVSSLTSAKRKLEADLSAMQADLEESAAESRAADDKFKAAVADASRMADELRQEQDHAMHMDKLRKQLETQVKELTVRIEESESGVLKGGRKAFAKLEQQVKELEAELEAEQRRHTETTKNLRRADHRCKELGSLSLPYTHIIQSTVASLLLAHLLMEHPAYTISDLLTWCCLCCFASVCAVFQSEEDKKGQERLQEIVDKLQAKVKTLKRQVEEAVCLGPAPTVHRFPLSVPSVGLAMILAKVDGRYMHAGGARGREPGQVPQGADRAAGRRGARRRRRAGRGQAALQVARRVRRHGRARPRDVAHADRSRTLISPALVRAFPLYCTVATHTVRVYTT